MQQNRTILNRSDRRLLISLRFTSILFTAYLYFLELAFKEKTVAKYLQCSECGKLAFYYDDFVGTEKPFYKRFMRYPEGETKHEPPRCFSCGGVPRLIHENIKEEKAAAKH